MAKMMILGVKGEAGLWLVDFDTGTVTAMDGKREDYIIPADGVSAAHKGTEALDVAVAFEPTDAAFSGHVWKTSQVDVAVDFEPKETAFSGHLWKTSQVDVAIGFEPKESAFSGHVWKTPNIELTAAV